MVEITSRTFADWSNLGYQIIKGSKSATRDKNGIPLFERSQVMRARIFHAYVGGDFEDSEADRYTGWED